MCAVVNRVGVLQLRHRHRHRHRKSRLPRVVTITDEPNLSATTSRINSHIRWRNATRSPFNSHRNAASPKRVAVLHLRYRYRKSGMPRVVTITDELNLSAATSRIHTPVDAATIAVQLASKRDIAKALQEQQAEFGATRRLLSIRYPTIQCYRSNSRYQVTPHRMSCPCLVSFSVGHYDVLVSTPDSMFSVV